MTAQAEGGTSSRQQMVHDMAAATAGVALTGAVTTLATTSHAEEASGLPTVPVVVALPVSSEEGGFRYR